MSLDAASGAARHVPIACVPGAIPKEKRPEHFALIARLFSEALRERQEIPQGYAYRFDEDSFADVASFVENERRCCPFLTFALELTPSDDALWLRLTGPDGTRAFLDGELSQARDVVA